MIFVDSNVPMYIIGAEHPHKETARRLLEANVAAGERLVTSAEVFQELLHRFTAIGRREAIEPAFDLLRAVVDQVYAIELEDVERARTLLLTWPALSARDALHLVVLQRHGIGRILSFDGHFDGIPGVVRVH